MTIDQIPFRIVVDADTCIGSATCVSDAPQVFRLDDMGRAEVFAPEVATLEIALAAASNCPSEAIDVLGQDGTSILSI